MGNCPKQKPYGLGLFFAKLYCFGAISHELAPYLVIEGKDGIELVRGQLHSLGSDKGQQGMREGLEVQAMGVGCFYCYY